MPFCAGNPSDASPPDVGWSLAIVISPCVAPPDAVPLAPPPPLGAGWQARATKERMASSALAFVTRMRSMSSLEPSFLLAARMDALVKQPDFARQRTPSPLLPLSVVPSSWPASSCRRSPTVAEYYGRLGFMVKRLASECRSGC